MNVSIIIPSFGESVSEASVSALNKKVGDLVKVDEVIAEIETDKVTLELNAPVAGVLKSLNIENGSKVTEKQIAGEIDPTGDSPDTPADAPSSTPPIKKEEASPVAAAVSSSEAPSVRKIATENNLNLENIKGTGKENRITKGDALNALTEKPTVSDSSSTPSSGERVEEVVKMSKLRQTIAKRLKESQDTAAILTTFNEIDMSNLIEIRTKYKEDFQKKHDIKLGFMSFFLKASVIALQETPSVNASIVGDSIVYRRYCDIGVAVGTPSGLVVPVIKNADKMSFAELEESIYAYGVKARDGKLALSDLKGGTFTVSNGGVYGSLFSTPIINPPQSGILGMHAIKERPAVVDGQVVARPMMYIALSYDHRIVDGKEAVTFLSRIKECVEDPSRLVFDI